MKDDDLINSKMIFFTFVLFLNLTLAAFTKERTIFQILFFISWLIGVIYFSYLFIKLEIKESKEKQKPIIVTINYIIVRLLNFCFWFIILGFGIFDKLLNYFDKEIFIYNNIKN